MARTRAASSAVATKAEAKQPSSTTKNNQTEQCSRVLRKRKVDDSPPLPPKKAAKAKDQAPITKPITRAVRMSAPSYNIATIPTTKAKDQTPIMVRMSAPSYHTATTKAPSRSQKKTTSSAGGDESCRGNRQLKTKKTNEKKSTLEECVRKSSVFAKLPSRIKADLASMTSAGRESCFNAVLKNYNDTKEGLIKKIAEANNKLRERRYKVEELNNDQEEVEMEIEDNEAEIEANEAKLKKLKQEDELLDKTLDELEAREDELQKTTREMRHNNSVLHLEASTLRESNKQLQNTLTRLLMWCGMDEEEAVRRAAM
ncbi:hypothetical protein PFISCL1PPCAC_23928 [Pristionchus fissidentatus]|uniref:Uncharacterized protein n=1 Tax=Pristionchus fissidentatus TaxID=1538716 RepID=A0AAV5WNV3_9BILA|nr:hypothetical protein PFISCL1PPCAC_23928 [Pristionchus fissidentatus]